MYGRISSARLLRNTDSERCVISERILCRSIVICSENANGEIRRGGGGKP